MPCVKGAKDIDPAGFPVNPENQQIIVNQRFAVSFSLGIATRNAGLNPLQGFLASLLNNASAGEYAAFTLIAANATYLEVAIITLISNARYLLMSCALAQRFSEDTPFIHRLFIAYDVTDKLFGITIARPGYLNPFSFKWNKDHSFDGDPVFCCCDPIPGHPGKR